MNATSVPGRRGRPGLYPGWAMVGALGVTTCVSYGILLYAFAVFLAPMEADLGWSRTQLTGAFSLSALVAGLAAVPAGRWVDRHGARWLMTGGSVLATALVLAWSQVERLATFYALWVGLGVAAAAVLYEPAFAVVAVWFDRHRSRALTLLTFGGGFASVVFVPLASWLVGAFGWRAALAWLAAVLGAVTIPLHAGLLRRHPADLGLRPDGGAAPLRPGEGAPEDPTGPPGSPHREEEAATTRPLISVRDVVRQRPFLLLTAAFGLATVASTAMTVHLVPLLLERGHPASFAAGAMGVLGLMALPGRLVFTPLGGVLPRAAVTAAIFALQALSAVPLLLGTSTTAVWLFVALFGAGFGAVTPARAALLAELYGPSAYGAIAGVMALALAAARCVAPVGASLLHAGGGGYRAVTAAALLASAASAALTLAARGEAPVAGRRSRVPAAA